MTSTRSITIGCVIALGCWGSSPLWAHSGAISRLLYAFNGQVLVAANEFGALQFWSPTGVEPVRRIEPEWVGAPMAVRPGDDHDVVIAGRTSPETAAVWKVSRQGQVKKLLDIPVKDVKTLTLSQDSSLLVAATWEGKTVILDIGSGKVIGGRGSRTTAIDVMAISPDNRILAASSGKALEVWNVANNHRYASVPETGTVIALDFTPDSGKLLVDVGDEVHVWTATLDKRLGMTSKGRATGAFDPRGTFTVLATETELHLWDLARGRVVETIPVGGSRDAAGQADASQIGAVAFSPDGKRVAIGLVSGRVIVKEIGGRK